MIRQNYILILFCLILFLPPFFEGGNNNFILVLLFFLGAIFFLLTKDKLNFPPFLSRKTWFSPIFWAIFFLLAFFLTNFFSVTPYFSWTYFLEILFFIFLFLTVAFYPLPQDFFRKISFTFLLVATILCLYGIFVYETAHASRLMATFSNSNAFAGYLLFILPFSLFFHLKAKNEKVILFSLIAILIFSAFILTNSRASYLSFLPAFFLLSFLSLKKISLKEFFRKILILFIGCFILVNLLFSLKVGELSFFSIHLRIPIPGQKIESSIALRFEFWKGAFSMFKDKPLTGWGLLSYGEIYPRYQTSPIAYAKYTHNHYLETLAETGFSGAIPFYFFIFFLIFLGFKTFKKNNLAFVFFLSIFSSILHSFFDFDWHFRANFLTFFIMAGLFLNALRITNQYEYTNKSINFSTIVKKLIIFVSIVFILISIILAYSFYHFQQGKNFEKVQKYESALLHYQKGTKINPHSDYLLQEGILLYSKGELKDAENVAQKLKLLDPQNSEVFRLLGKIENERKNFKKAEENFKKAISLNPFHLQVYFDLTNLYLEKEKFKEAEKLLDGILPKYDETSIGYFKAMRRSFAKSLNVEQKEVSLYLPFTFVEDISKLYYLRGKVAKAKGDESLQDHFFKKAKEIIEPLK